MTPDKKPDTVGALIEAVLPGYRAELEAAPDPTLAAVRFGEVVASWCRDQADPADSVKTQATKFVVAMETVRSWGRSPLN